MRICQYMLKQMIVISLYLPHDFGISCEGPVSMERVLKKF